MPHEQIREENKQRVLECAIEICSEDGLEKMSLGQVASAAHVSIRSLFRYYETKDKLIEAIVLVTMRDFESTIRKVMETSEKKHLNGAEEIIEIVRTMLIYVKNNSKIMSKLVSAEPYLMDIGLSDWFGLFDTSSNHITQYLIDVLKKGYEDASLSDIAEDRAYYRTLAVVFRGFLSRIAVISANEAMKERYNPDELIEEFIKEFRNSHLR